MKQMNRKVLAGMLVIGTVFLIAGAILTNRSELQEIRRWDFSTTYTRGNKEFQFSDFTMETDQGAFVVRNECDYPVEAILVQEKMFDAGEEDGSFPVMFQVVAVGGTYVQYQIEKNTPYRIGVRADERENVEIKVAVLSGGEII